MTTACYGSDVDDTQRDALVKGQTAVDQAVRDHKDALTRRDEKITTLRRKGLGATDLTRVLSEGRAHPVNRVTVGRLLVTAGLGREPLDRKASRAFGAGPDELTALGREDLLDDRAELRASQALVDQAAAAISRAVARRDAVIVRLATREAVGPTEQATVLDMTRKSIQDIVDGHRRSGRTAAESDQ